VTKVAKTSDIPADTGKTVEVSGTAIALFRCNGQIYAIENTCQHAGGPLGEGSLSGACVTCPWHGWEYDVTTGVCQTNPSVTVRTFPVTIQGDDVFVTLPS
jgi:nitrite reductase (NADH) small subunit/3-phenylpropionate/trans-cinnamate dioxygenase ferredoxin subunit